jgi:phosphoribosylformylglycinamidine synthase
VLVKVNVIVKPKETVLDPQGSAVREAMRHLGMPEVRSVRIGKYMEIEVEGSKADLEKRLHGLCRDLLSNPVIEDYELQRSEVPGHRSANGGHPARRRLGGGGKSPAVKKKK